MATATSDAPAEEPQLTSEEAATKLTNLRAAATKEYSLKNYSQAADYYSEAIELQASVNGEMSPRNAELLYAYGRCLYHVAISKSDVLGTKVAGGEEPKKKKRKTESAAIATSSDALKSADERTAEEVVGAIVEEKTGDKTGTKSAEKDASKPFFQITGDENWTDSEDEEDDDDAEVDGEADEEDDDFQTAYEVLDLARVLLTKQLDESNQSSMGKGKGTEAQEITPEKRAVMERLADTQDLQAEIWLESERFSDAIPDFQAALEQKLKLYPAESSLIAEAHYKLSLALEFASIRKTEQEGEAAEAAPAANGAAAKEEVDEEMRREAAGHMEKAIASCRARVAKESGLLASSTSEDERERKKRNIKDVEDMIQDLEQRLNDLKNPPAAASVPALDLHGGPGGDVLGGILGSILGESKQEQKARIAEATKGANDLSGLVRKKQPAATAAAAASSKRKLEDGNEGANGESTAGSKKAKVEDA